MEYDKSGELSPAEESALVEKIDKVLFRHFAPEDENYRHGWEFDGWTIIMYNGFTGEYTYTVHASRNKNHYPEFFPKTDNAREYCKEIRALLDSEGYEYVRTNSVNVGCFGSIKFKRKENAV